MDQESVQSCAGESFVKAVAADKEQYFIRLSNQWRMEI